MNDTPLSLPDPVERALARTTARVLVGRSGPAYRTSTMLALRADHAAARDAVHAEIDLLRDFGRERVERFGLFEVKTQAGSKTEYLRRPDLGRKLSIDSCQLIELNCPKECDFQVVIGDGLSPAAVAAQAPELLDRLNADAVARGQSFGKPFFVRYCRVGAMNDVGDLLAPQVLVMLVGERPGLATAESLSAYLAYRPRTGQTDADRNLISNIHFRGIGLDVAATRIAAFAERIRSLGRSGVGVVETKEAAFTESTPLELK